MSHLVDPIVGKISTNQKITNALWRESKKVTNLKDIKRRDVKFFEGSLGYLNIRENIYVSERNKVKKLKSKNRIARSMVISSNKAATGSLPPHIKVDP